MSRPWSPDRSPRPTEPKVTARIDDPTIWVEELSYYPQIWASLVVANVPSGTVATTKRYEPAYYGARKPSETSEVHAGGCAGQDTVDWIVVARSHLVQASRLIKESSGK